MDKMVARLNIEHCRQRLEEESDPSKRELLLRRLAEEEAKLAGFAGPAKERKSHR